LSEEAPKDWVEAEERRRRERRRRERRRRRRRRKVYSRLTQ